MRFLYYVNEVYGIYSGPTLIGQLVVLSNCRYVSGVVGNTEWAWKLSDQFDGFDWEQFARGKPFVFFQVSALRRASPLTSY